MRVGLGGVRAHSRSWTGFLRGVGAFNRCLMIRRSLWIILLRLMALIRRLWRRCVSRSSRVIYIPAGLRCLLSKRRRASINYRALCLAIAIRAVANSLKNKDRIYLVERAMWEIDQRFCHLGLRRKSVRLKWSWCPIKTQGVCQLLNRDQSLQENTFTRHKSRKISQPSLKSTTVLHRQPLWNHPRAKALARYHQRW